MKHNVIIFSNVISYIFIIIFLAIILFHYSGNLLAFGIGAGLFSAAIGWALQRPITGLAAWIMVVVKRPFRIGDRISLNGIKGDVTDITLTHIYLKEVGGTINSEEVSGRVVMIPNSILFEQNIINYTFQDEYVLDEIKISVTYESNLEKAIKICKDVAEKVLEVSSGKNSKEKDVQVSFNDSGIDIKLKYYVKIGERIKLSSEITKGIFKEFAKEKDVDFAYPHTEVILKKK